MCGIAGLYHFAAGSDGARDQVAAMTDRLTHRGPDDRGEYVDPAGRVALGHTRLSIIDPAGGRQPMAGSHGWLRLVFNGEIYNHRKLREQLGDRPFRTSSDAEAILGVYERFGVEGIERLAGMFAFALWDGVHRRVILARDRLGIKPLYYAVRGGTLFFASEVQALLATGRVGADLDPAAVRQYLELRAVPAPRTLFRHVRKLEPGHVLVCDRLGPGSPRPFWNLETPRTVACRDDTDAVEQVGTRLERSVRAHMLSDVPVGALLSGGLDSSLIVAAMSRCTDAPIHTFHVGSPEAGYDEFEYARHVARRFSTRHHEHVLTADDLVRFLPALVADFADPVADPAAIPLFFISRVAREQGIKVLLSGEGSDEIFAGYPAYQRYLLPGAPWARLRRWPRTLARTWRRERRLRRLVGDRLRPGRARRAFYPGHAALDDPALLDAVLVPGVRDAAGLLEETHEIARRAGMDRLQTMLYIDLKTRIPEDLLCRTDRMTMANGVEARVPFLDHELVEHGLWLPSHFKIRGGVSKYVIKRLAERVFPADFVHRRKMGFPTPVRRWLSAGLRDVFRGGLLGIQEEPAVFDRQVLARLVAAHAAGADDVGLLLWRIWFFKLWFVRWVAREPIDVDALARRSTAVAVGR
jgi:asparagine synthase (glutamine-hydrolysing)